MYKLKRTQIYDKSPLILKNAYVMTTEIMMKFMQNNYSL